MKENTYKVGDRVCDRERDLCGEVIKLTFEPVEWGGEVHQCPRYVIQTDAYVRYIQQEGYLSPTRVCRTCKTEKALTHTHIQQIADGDCFQCYFWTDVFSSNPENLVITDDYTVRSFQLNKPVSGERNSDLGYGGRWWKITFTDGREFQTNNLWCRGTMPEYWRQFYKPNAIIGDVPRSIATACMKVSKS